MTKPQRQERWYELEQDDDHTGTNERRRNKKGSRGRGKTVTQAAQLSARMAGLHGHRDDDEHTGTDETKRNSRGRVKTMTQAAQAQSGLDRTSTTVDD